MNPVAHRRMERAGLLVRCSIPLAMSALAILSGCSSSMSSIDESVADLLAGSSATLGDDAATPRALSGYSWRDERPMDEPGDPNRDPNAETLSTVNPPAKSLTFNPVDESEDVMARLSREMGVEDPNAEPVDLARALQIAVERSREHQFAEEEYIIAALRLLIERHRWGPRFFNEVSATASGSGDDGLFDSSLRLVNEFRVTQRLPYGGEVSARALARATEDLHQFVSGEDTTSADLILSANFPLLRGAGVSARNSRIQAERNLIYAARSYERFRREFFFDVSQDFLDLIVTKRSIGNAERQVASLQYVQSREQSLYEEGRSSRFDLALAENETVEALDRLASTRERYRLAVDRFKVRIGMEPDEPIVIVPSSLGIGMPEVELATAVEAALTNRLDLQTRRDQIDDALRSVEIARNDLLPDLDFSASISVPSDRDQRRSAFDPEPGDGEFSVGINFDVPLDREIERLSLRESQLDYEQSLRSYNQFRDNVTIDVRGTVREIERARFSLEIQERNIEIAEQRIESIEADPIRATIRDRTEATNQLTNAQNARDAALRDLDVAVLRYLLDTGQLRVEPNGMIQALQGMQLNYSIDPEDPDEDAGEMEENAPSDG